MIIAAQNLCWILDKPEYGYLASDIIVYITINSPQNSENRSETGPCLTVWHARLSDPSTQSSHKEKLLPILMCLNFFGFKLISIYHSLLYFGREGQHPHWQTIYITRNSGHYMEWDGIEWCDGGGGHCSLLYLDILS